MCLDEFGNELWRHRFSGPYLGTQVAVADITGDGETEVVALAKCAVSDALGEAVILSPLPFEEQDRLYAFLEEYCADDEEAFQFAGTGVFPVKVIEKMRSIAKPIGAVVEITRPFGSI